MKLPSPALVPSVLSFLASNNLRQLAGAQSFARGKEYFRAGRVIDLLERGTSADALVQGRGEYEVTVGLDRNEPLYACSCPIGEEGVFCKHCVAAALAWRARRGNIEDAKPNAPSDPKQSPPTSQNALLRWARESGVEDQLGIGAEAILSSLDADIQRQVKRYHLSCCSVGLVASGEAFERIGVKYFLNKTIINKVQSAAWDFLLAEAESVRIGIEEERQAASVKTPLPEAPTLSVLAAKLAEGRARVRRRAKPRSRASLASSELRFESEPPAFVYQERLPVLLAEQNRFGRPRVTISVENWKRGRLIASCNCSLRPESQCIHALAAFDAALALLHNPNQTERARQIAEEVSRPPWSHALQALDKARAARQRLREKSHGFQICWGFEEAYDEWRIVPFLQRRTSRGEFSHPIRVQPRQIKKQENALIPGIDRAVLDLVLRAERSYGDERAEIFRDAVIALKAHPRVFRSGLPLEPMAIREERLSYAVCEERRKGFSLIPRIGERQIDVDAALELLEKTPPDKPAIWVDAQGQTCWIVAAEPEALDLLQILSKFGTTFPLEALEEVIARFTGRADLSLSLSPALRGEERTPQVNPVLQLTPLPTAGVGLKVRVRPIPEGSLFCPGEGPVEAYGLDDGKRVYTRRDFAIEISHATATLSTLPLQDAATQGPWNFTIDRDEEALNLVASLQALPTGTAMVEWCEEALRITRPAQVADLRVTIEDRMDWFGLSGEVEVDGEKVLLAALLDAVRRNQRYVRISGGKWLAIAEALRERLGQVADLAFDGEHGLEIGPAAVQVLDDLASDGARLHPSKTWSALLEKIRTAGTLEPKIPSLSATLREYQIAGFRWLARLAAWGAGACLADDMGLGKTIQALAILADRAPQGPALVVAPTSVCFNWIREVERFAPSLRAIPYRKVDREELVRTLGAGDLLILSYGLLVRDVERLKEVHFSTMILDEAQALKNAATRRARAARELDAEFRIALTGTPVENHVGELWSLFRIIFPGLFGSWEQFRQRFAIPIERHQDACRRAALARMIRPFLLRRSKEEVASELPPRTESQISIPLSSGEWRVYDQARLAAIAQLAGTVDGAALEKKRFQVLAAITRLRRLACHPRLDNPASTLKSSKLTRFLEIVAELREEGHRALVFSQFTSHLALVREELDRLRISYLYLDGKTPAGQRGKLVDAFQASKADLFLISLKAGGTGLNLTGADYVIHLDPWWNPAVEDQATDRAHRIGQTRPVTIYRLVASGTIEEQILRLHAKKRDLVSGILEGADAAGSLSAEELVDLIRFRGKSSLADENDNSTARDPPGLVSPDGQATEPVQTSVPQPARSAVAPPSGPENPRGLIGASASAECQRVAREREMRESVWPA